MIDGTMVWDAFFGGIDAAKKGLFVGFRPALRSPKTAPMLASRAIRGRRLCAQNRDGAVPLLRLKRSQLARAQAFAARDLAARCPFWLFGM
jgi:hypothetical protein